MLDLFPGDKNLCEMVSAVVVATNDEVEKKEVATEVEGRHHGIGHKTLLRSDALYQVHYIQFAFNFLINQTTHIYTGRARSKHRILAFCASIATVL
jgi:hypothetical protein